MADVVIIVGARRGHEGVSASEIRQMVGRAGRRHGGESKAYVLVDTEDAAEVEGCVKGDVKLNVESSMASCDDIVFHIVPGLCNGTISNEEQARVWYERSLGAAQGRRPDIGKVFERLVGCGAVEVTDDGYRPTELARIAADLYFHPADVKAWRDNFERVFESGLEGNDLALAWALGSVPMTQAPGDFGNHRHVMTMYRDELPGQLEAEAGMVAKGALWWSALGGPGIGRMRNVVVEIRKGFGRTHRALRRIDASEGWGMGEFFDKLAEKVRRGVPERLVELCSISGMTKGMAEYLHGLGISDRQGIADALDSLDGDMDAKAMDFLREVVDGVR